MIAGTGIANLFMTQGWSRTDTPFGPAFLATGRIGTQDVVVLARHGKALNIPPHLINYRANIWALKKARVTRVIGTAAVGSLREDLDPGALAVVSDFIDFTKRRVGTFFEKVGERAVHTDFSVPYCPEISGAIEQVVSQTSNGDCSRVTYVCVDGPRYETPAEIRMFASCGGDVVGMTGVPEVALARELGLCYGALAIVTNYAAGVSAKPLSHGKVTESVREQGARIRHILDKALSLIHADMVCSHCAAGHPDSLASGS